MRLGPLAHPWVRVLAGVVALSARAEVSLADETTPYVLEAAADRLRWVGAAGEVEGTVDGGEVRLRVRSGAETATVSGPFAQLDRVLDDVACAALDAEACGRARAYLAAHHLPLAVHEALASADARAAAGRRTSAQLQLDGALRKAKGGVPLPVLDRLGRWFPAVAPEILDEAVVRGRVARRSGRHEAALGAFVDALRHGALPGRLWWSETRGAVRGLERGVLFGSPQGSWVRAGRTGGLEAKLPYHGAVVWTERSEHIRKLDDGTLLRMGPEGERWKLSLPEGWSDTVYDVGSGHLLAEGAAGVAWVDAALGRVTARRGGARPVAVGEIGGVLPIAGGVGLLRPGRDAWAWTATVAGRAAVQLTQSRVLVETHDGLVVLDAHDGRERGRAFPGEAVSVLGAKGRHAVLARKDGKAWLVDILAGDPVGPLRGPGAPVAAAIGETRISVLYAGGDVLHYDGDAIYVGRGWVPAAASATLGYLSAEPEVLVVVSERRVTALGVPRDQTPSAPQVMVQAAAAAQAAGKLTIARALLERVARDAAASLRDAERARAELLEASALPGAKASAALARARAEAAADPERPLPPFALFAPPSLKAR